jgi:endoglucanase Acf2
MASTNPLAPARERISARGERSHSQTSIDAPQHTHHHTTLNIDNHQLQLQVVQGDVQLTEEEHKARLREFEKINSDLDHLQSVSHVRVVGVCMCVCVCVMVGSWCVTWVAHMLIILY